MAKSAGYMTELTTEAGRPIYIDQNGEPVSEKSMTIEVDGKWVNVPSIHDGIIYNEDELADMVRNKEIKPTSTHKSQELAVKKARSRSGGLMSPETEQKLREQYADFMGQRESLAAERMEDVPEGFSDQGIMAAEDKVLEKQMTTAFAEGGLLDEGGAVDPVSGNDVPVGSTKEEVRDDIPAQLSEGEFVLPADVVRYIGLENLMQLRSKAKQGLAQMEAMGQMGNSEEATMEDDGEYDAYIDEMIDSFDPNDPETLKFAEGGMPTYQYQPQQNIYSPTANYNPYTGMTGQPQQFTAGYMPQTAYQAPPVYGANSGRFTSGQPTAGGTAEQRQYVGPNGELRTFTFIDGKPTEEIPAGFTVYKPEEKAEPQIVKPDIAQVSQDGGDNAEAEAEREAEYAGYVSEMSQLAQLDDTIGELWSGSLHNPNNTKGFKDTLGNFIKAGGIAGAVKNDYAMHQAAQAAAPNIAQAYGLDIENYKNKGLASIFSTYNTDALASDAITSKAVAEALGMDPRDLARTNIDTDRDGRISKEEAKRAEADLFMDIEGEDVSKSDPAPSTPSTSPTDYESEAAGVGSSRGTDAANVDSGRGGMGPSGSGPSGGGGQSDSQSAASAAQDDPSAGFGGYAKGGAVQEQTQRALKSSRKK